VGARQSEGAHLGLVTTAGLVLLALFGGVPAALSLIPEPTCPDATLVFARGSGQDPGAGDATMFFALVYERRGDLRLDHMELDYPAAGGREILVGARLGALGGGSGQRYRASVDDGRRALVPVVADLLDECPHQQIVLGGFSQGAQVIGEGLFDLPAAHRSPIAFVALFGDPTLLTNGQGALPRACFGDHRPWRRGSIRCYQDGGVLGPRDPYVPLDIEDRVGSWCDRRDGICNGNEALFLAEAHGEYPAEEMPEAADEIVDRLTDRGR
jgi:predicted esterase